MLFLPDGFCATSAQLQAMNTAGQQLEVEGARLAPHAQGAARFASEQQCSTVEII